MIKAARELGFTACKLLCLIVESAVNCTLPSFARGINLFALLEPFHNFKNTFPESSDMKITKTKYAAASFGAAMTSLYAAPELNAQLVDLSFSPNTVPFVNLNAEENYPGEEIDLVAGAVNDLVIFGYNNLPLFGAPVTLIFDGFSNVGSLNTTGGVLEAGDVFDGMNSALDAVDRLQFPSTTGVQYFGFEANNGDLGWFSVDLGATPGMMGNTVTFIDGQILLNTGPGDTITIPGGDGAPDVVLLGDVNLDGMVNFLDIAPFISRLADMENQAEADLNEDGVVNFLDISPFIQALTNGGMQVTWLDSTGKPLARFAGNEVLDQQLQAIERKLQDEINTALAQANSSAVEPESASVGLAALALGAVGLRRRRKAATA